MSQANDAERAYHHGDLAATLMDLALERIAEEGSHKVSLRALAREAGVSATAPYRHFPTKRCLFAAIATRGFRQMRERMLSACSDDLPLEERFIALGLTYIDYALENPATYQLMFGQVLDDFSGYEELGEAATASYAVLLGMIRELQERNPSLTRDTEELGAVVWAGVHGISSLLQFYLARREQTASVVPRRSLATLYEQQEQALRMLMQGLLVDTSASTG